MFDGILFQVMTICDSVKIDNNKGLLGVLSVRTMKKQKKILNQNFR